MIVLKNLTQLNKIYPEASLGTQRRTMMGNNSREVGKKVAQAVGLGAAAKAGADGWDSVREEVLIPIVDGVMDVMETFKSVTTNTSGGSTSGKSSPIATNTSGGSTSGKSSPIATNTSEGSTNGKSDPTTTKSEVAVNNGSNADPIGTSQDVSQWDPIRILNPEWLFSNSPFNVETTADLLLLAVILFIIALIIIINTMWGAYYSNTVTSFVIGKKKLPVYHLALISIAVLMGVFSLSLVYAAVFTGMMVEAVSLKGLSSDLARLQSEIEELRTLVELQSHEEGK